MLKIVNTYSPLSIVIMSLVYARTKDLCISHNAIKYPNALRVDVDSYNEVFQGDMLSSTKVT